MVRSLIGIMIPLIVTTTAQAGIVLPTAEDFEAGAANWYNAAETAEVDWASSGGFDGGGYVTASTLVPDPVPGSGLTLFRAQDEFGSSGGIFEGDWITGGVTELNFWIRHDAAAPLSVFARASGPMNFPGAVLFEFAPILPNTWTQVSIDISPTNPAILFEGPSTFGSVFSDVGHLQFGVLPDDPLIGSTITIDLDQVSLLPAPSVLALLAVGGFAGRRRRRS